MILPKHFAPVLFGFFMSGIVALIVSGAITLLRVGATSGWIGIWLANYALAWSVAFPSVVVAAPITRRLVALITKD